VDRGVTDPLQGRYGGVFRSSDAGATWTQVNDLQAIPHYYYDGIWIDPANPDHVWTVSPSLLESKDGGKSFAPDSCLWCTEITTAVDRPRRLAALDHRQRRRRVRLTGWRARRGST